MPELPEALRAAWDKLDFDAEALLARSQPERARRAAGSSVLEQTQARPTCEINGMGGGYQGEGFKTVIPAVASAKVSFRLVFDQDPEKIRESFRAYVSSHVPADCGVEFIGHGSGMAVAFDTEGGHFQSVKRALSDEWGREAAFIGGGGSIQ